MSTSDNDPLTIHSEAFQYLSGTMSGFLFHHHDLYMYYVKIFYPTKAAAWAKPSRGQALFDGFGLAWVLRKPKPWLSGQAGPGTSLDEVEVDENEDVLVVLVWEGMSTK